MQEWHFKFTEMGWIYVRRKGFELVNVEIRSFMDRMGEILENVPDSVCEVKVKQVKIMDFRDGMDVVPF